MISPETKLYAMMGIIGICGMINPRLGFFFAALSILSRAHQGVAA